MKPFAKKIIIAVIASDFVIFGFLWYMGIFANVEVREKEMGPYIMLYREQKGNYRQTGRNALELKTAGESAGLAGGRMFGMYYDEAGVVPEDQLRSDAGVLYAGGSADQKALEVLGAKHNAKVKAWPVQRSATAEFPLRNFLSAFIGYAKVSPVLLDHLQSGGYDRTYGLVIYDADRMTYCMPLVKPVPAR
ncbi:MAG: hypothetical protein HY042_09130 [Spirochaetia bacterium]|nr:hypothetical protein [Spirochaetia bacterium]